jgi:hypothetical protein
MLLHGLEEGILPLLVETVLLGRRYQIDPKRAELGIDLEAGGYLGADTGHGDGGLIGRWFQLDQVQVVTTFQHAAGRAKAAGSLLGLAVMTEHGGGQAEGHIRLAGALFANQEKGQTLTLQRGGQLSF